MLADLAPGDAILKALIPSEVEGRKIALQREDNRRLRLHSPLL